MKMAERTEEQHTEKMKKKQAAHDQIVAAKTIEKGLLIVHTGKGKGKTTAALGMVVRAIGHGKKIGVVQFVKGAMTTGEKPVFDAFPELGRASSRERVCQSVSLSVVAASLNNHKTYDFLNHTNAEQQ